MIKLEPFGIAIHAKDSKPITNRPPREILSLLQEHRLVLARGFKPMSRDEFLSYCLSFPSHRPLEWSFGPVMEMKEASNPQNYLFSREAVPFHWDGAFHIVPDYLVFYCVEAPTSGAGGETLFTNTEAIFADAPTATRELWSNVVCKYQTATLAHYGGSIAGPLVQRHPKTHRPILRFAESVSTQFNPVDLEISGISTLDQSNLIESLTKKIYSPAYCYRHRWQRGDVLIADNHSLIHGRAAFEKDVPRHLHRIQLLTSDREL